MSQTRVLSYRSYSSIVSVTGSMATQSRPNECISFLDKYSRTVRTRRSFEDRRKFDEMVQCIPEELGVFKNPEISKIAYILARVDRKGLSQLIAKCLTELDNRNAWDPFKTEHYEFLSNSQACAALWAAVRADHPVSLRRALNFFTRKDLNVRDSVGAAWALLSLDLPQHVPPFDYWEQYLKNPSDWKGCDIGQFSSIMKVIDRSHHFNRFHDFVVNWLSQGGALAPGDISVVISNLAIYVNQSFIDVV